MTAVTRAARSVMTYRCAIERNSGGTVDADGYPSGSSWAAVATVPCYPWMRVGRELAEAPRTAVLKDTRLLVPKGTDVHEGDRVGDVVDRRGTVYLAGPFDIDAVVPRATHLELAVRGVHE